MASKQRKAIESALITQADDTWLKVRSPNRAQCKTGTPDLVKFGERLGGADGPEVVE